MKYKYQKQLTEKNKQPNCIGIDSYFTYSAKNYQYNKK